MAQTLRCNPEIELNPQWEACVGLIRRPHLITTSSASSRYPTLMGDHPTSTLSAKLPRLSEHFVCCPHDYSSTLSPVQSLPSDLSARHFTECLPKTTASSPVRTSTAMPAPSADQGFQTPMPLPRLSRSQKRRRRPSQMRRSRSRRSVVSRHLGSRALLTAADEEGRPGAPPHRDLRNTTET